MKHLYHKLFNEIVHEILGLLRLLNEIIHEMLLALGFFNEIVHEILVSLRLLNEVAPTFKVRPLLLPSPMKVVLCSTASDTGLSLLVASYDKQEIHWDYTFTIVEQTYPLHRLFFACAAEASLTSKSHYLEKVVFCCDEFPNDQQQCCIDMYLKV
ncbi:hypothetical protein CEXT_135561 [Caerostris extrusa]|uniref:Uncharacterized protein n=1 Tax=Caerostris extrusa TaxID=172846 RepID=A0AAV4RTK3_CAEEX|nr:hypothetical protein CEXT_135561 [Caerostris extrusa]